MVEIALFVSVLASFPITGLLGVKPIIPSILLPLSIPFFVFERSLRWSMHKHQWSKPKKRSEPLVNTERLFETMNVPKTD